MNHCPKCHQDYLYDPKHHRCPGEWEAMVGALPEPELLPWDEECVRKVMEP